MPEAFGPTGDVTASTAAQPGTPPVSIDIIGSGCCSYASAINDYSTVAGGSVTAGNTATHAFVWTQAGGMVDLGTLGGTHSNASAINDNGMVGGTSSTAGNTASRAFVWTQAGGMVDLGT